MTQISKVKINKMLSGKYNEQWLGEVPPCRMLKFSTNAYGGTSPSHCYKTFFIGLT